MDVSYPSVLQAGRRRERVTLKRHMGDSQALDLLRTHIYWLLTWLSVITIIQVHIQLHEFLQQVVWSWWHLVGRNFSREGERSEIVWMATVFGPWIF